MGLLQGDGNGIVSIPTWTATGDFKITFPLIKITDANPAGAEVMIGSATASSNFIATFDDADPLLTDINYKINNITPPYIQTKETNAIVPVVVERISGQIRLTVDGNVGTAFANSDPFVLSAIFGFGDGSLAYSGTAEGIIEMVGDAGGVRTYDTNQAAGSTVLPDTTSGKNGTLSGFTTGGFTGAGNTLNITSVDNYDFLEWDSNEQAVFNVSGTLTGTQATTIQYSFDNSTWLTLDASPTATDFTGSVLVTKQQAVYVRRADDSAADQKILTAGMTIAIALAQSNAHATIINNQTLAVGAGNPVPIMYRNGTLSPLADPTGIDIYLNENGSPWVAIAQHYSDLGIPVCFGNVAKRGSLASQWAKGGALYAKITEFANAVGGISKTIGMMGESDSIAGTDKDTFKANYLAAATDINTDFGCDIYVVYFPVGSNTGTTVNVDAIRLGLTELIDSTAFLKFGGDLSVIDISSATDARNDDLHIKTDAAAAEEVSIIWSALTSVISTLNLTATGYPDGVYSAELYQATTPLTHIKTENVTFTSGVAVTTIPLVVGTTVYTRIDGATPPSTGVTCYGDTV